MCYGKKWVHVGTGEALKFFSGIERGMVLKELASETQVLQLNHQQNLLLNLVKTKFM